jgi:hypothetical protein
VERRSADHGRAAIENQKAETRNRKQKVKELRVSGRGFISISAFCFLLF